MTFEKKTILVTGASSGIGKAIGEKLAQIDCNLILTARQNEKIENWVSQLNNKNARVLILKNDVTDKQNVAEAFAKIGETFGNIDVAILNSGIGKSVSPQNFSSLVAEEIINTNFLGVIYWIEQLLPQMLKNEKGVIAPVSSLADNRGYSGSGFYCASKAALSIFTEGLAIDLAKFGIKVITIKPGFVKTPMTDQNKFKMPFMISAEKAADKIINGIKNENNIVQFPFPTVLGAKFIGMFPNWLYRLISK